MSSEKSFTFYPHSTPTSLQLKQKRILQEYNKLALGESDLLQSQIQSIMYQRKPTQLPSQLNSINGLCFGLYDCSLFDMFTLTIFEYIFTNSDSFKQAMIEDLKQLVYNDNFMEGDYYTKGMIVKGLQLINLQAQSYFQNNKLIAQCLFRQNLSRAFNEAWIEIINKITLQSSMDTINDIEGLYLLASCFMIKLSIVVDSCETVGDIQNSEIVIILNQSYKKQSLPQYLVFIKDYNPSSMQICIVNSQGIKQHRRQYQYSANMQYQISQNEKIDEISEKQTVKIKSLQIQNQQHNQKTASKNVSDFNLIGQINIKPIIMTIQATIKKGENLIQSCQQYLKQLSSTL